MVKVKICQLKKFHKKLSSKAFEEWKGGNREKDENQFSFIASLLFYFNPFFTSLFIILPDDQKIIFLFTKKFAMHIWHAICQANQTLLLLLSLFALLCGMRRMYRKMKNDFVLWIFLLMMARVMRFPNWTN